MSRLASGGLIDRTGRCGSASTAAADSGASPATRSPRRCLPMACAWSGAASNITARAASSAVGAEEPNALGNAVAARAREPNSEMTTIELFDGLEAKSQNRYHRSISTVGALNRLSPRDAGGILLQDLHVAGVVLKRLRTFPSLRGDGTRVCHRRS